MKTKFIILFLLSFNANFLFAQGENDNWYFGFRGAVNFSATIPVPLYESQMSAVEACGSISDANGNLLFYTNGGTIWDREHQPLQNGTGLTGTLSSQQLAIVKNPKNPNQYYVFTTADKTNPVNDFMAYTIVDMSLGFNGSNGQPLGAVVQNAKNIKILGDTGGSIYSEAITIVPKGTSNTAFWVLIPYGNILYSYSLDNNGFSNGNPVMSNLNFPTFSYNYFSIKASPAWGGSSLFSRLLCVSIFSPDTDIRNKVLSFNDLTGQITNHYSLVVNGLQSYVPEFSKNAAVLFLGYKNMYAVDLINSTQSNIIFKTIYSSTNPITFNAIQRNRKGDIYVAHNINRYYLGKIISPDIYSGNISVDLNNIHLQDSSNPFSNNQSSFGLPQLIENPNIDIYYPCINNLLLNTTETNNNFVYNVGNNIVTEADYFVSNDKQIIMNAGNSITFLPNTNIVAKQFLAKIVPCDRGSTSKQEFQEIRGLNQTNMVLELDKDERAKLMNNDINIFPNPVSDLLTIKSSTKVVNVNIYDISGKKINVDLNDNKVDVKNLPSGSYIIIIEAKEGKITKKFIKK